MHVLAPKPMNTEAPIFFNLDSSVGQNGNNSNPDDIMLVQFLIRTSAERNITNVGRDRIQRMLKVVIDGNCGPLTIDGIRAVQETVRDFKPATTVDGRASVAKGYQYGGGVYTIVALNASFRRRYPEMWPRLQNHPMCPPRLSTAIVNIL